MGTYRSMGDMEYRSPEDFVTYFNDFFEYAAGDWTITTIEAGASSATEALATDQPNGVLIITNDSNDDDSDFLQLLPADAHFKFTAGKRLLFKGRFKLSEATQADFIAGLYPTDTTPLALDDGIYFKSDDGDALLDVYVGKNNTYSSLAGVATLVSGEWVVLEAYYDGTDSIQFFVNGVRVASLPTTNAPDDVSLRPSFGYQNGSAGAKALSIDYIKVQQER